jgi:hypothetical protein
MPQTFYFHLEGLKTWRKSASPGFVAQASSVDQSVPPALYAGPEHLIVKIDAAVAQRLIEVVQHALPAGIRQVQFGVDDFLFSFARRAREREPCMARLASRRSKITGHWLVAGRIRGPRRS